ncbi:MAG: rhodanese-like domain-containing protein [Alcaligenaceae bacterium]|nr:rhodanese-like domain-containing protein [Alcaligenaceae bacterium]
MKKLLCGITLSLGMALAAPVALAEDIALSAQQTYELKTRGEQQILFVDVRDPVEIMFIGSTDVVDSNIPFMIVDRYTIDEEKGIFRMYRNPHFVNEIKSALRERGLAEDTMIVTMCRSGSERGKPSADFLRESGLNAYYVENGFQGSAIKEGEQAGFRTQNGWQNSGLPWSPKMNAEKAYRTPKTEPLQ